MDFYVEFGEQFKQDYLNDYETDQETETPPVIDVAPISSKRYSDQVRDEQGYDKMHSYFESRKAFYKLRGTMW